MDDDTFGCKYAAWEEQSESLDLQLRPIVQQEVDTSAPDWQKQLAARPHPADQSGLRREITDLFDELVHHFESLDPRQRQTIIGLMEKNQSLMYSAVIDADMETLEGFRKNMILFVIADQGKDTRDAIVALGRYRELGRKRG